MDMNPQNLKVRVLDSAERAKARRRELDIDRRTARRLGEEAITCIEQGWYPARDGRRVRWSGVVEQARQRKVSIRPDADLPTPPDAHPLTLVEIANETTLAAARRQFEAGKRPLNPRAPRAVRCCGD